MTENRQNIWIDRYFDSFREKAFNTFKKLREITDKMNKRYKILLQERNEQLRQVKSRNFALAEELFSKIKAKDPGTSLNDYTPDFTMAVPEATYRLSKDFSNNRDASHAFRRDTYREIKQYVRQSDEYEIDTQQDNTLIGNYKDSLGIIKKINDTDRITFVIALKRKRGSSVRSGNFYTANAFFKDSLTSGPDRYYSIDLTDRQKACEIYRNSIFYKLSLIKDQEEQTEDLEILFRYFFGDMAYAGDQVIANVRDQDIRALLNNRPDILPTLAELLLMWWIISGKTYPGKELIPDEFQGLRMKTLQIPASSINRVTDFNIVFDNPDNPGFQKVLQVSVKNDKNAHGQPSQAMFLTEYSSPETAAAISQLPDSSYLKIIYNYLQPDSELQQAWKSLRMGRFNKNVLPYWVAGLKALGLNYSDKDLLIHYLLFKEVYFKGIKDERNSKVYNKIIVLTGQNYHLKDFDSTGRITREYQEAFSKYFGFSGNNFAGQRPDLQIKARRAKSAEFYGLYGVSENEDTLLPFSWPSLCIKLIADNIEKDQEAKAVLADLLFNIHYYEYDLNFRPSLDLRTARAGESPDKIKVVAKGTSTTNGAVSWTLGGIGITLKVLPS